MNLDWVVCISYTTLLLVSADILDMSSISNLIKLMITKVYIQTSTET